MSLCKSTNRTNQRLEALDFYYGFRQCRQVQFVDDVAGSLDGEYFDLNTIDENYAEAKYAVLLSDGTTTAIPGLPSGTTQITVTYTANDDAATIAGLFVAALVAGSVEVNTLVDPTDTVEYHNQFLGEITDEDQSNAGSLTFTLNVAGTGGYLGAINEGGGTLNIEQTLFDIFSDQSGPTIPLDRLNQGQSITMDLGLTEMPLSRWEFLVGDGLGDKIGAGGSLEGVGYGTSKLFKSAFDFSAQLVGHPVRLALSDRSQDICMWKATYVLNTINYSGTDKQVADSTFTALEDDTKPAKVSQFYIGDHSTVTN